MRCNTACSGVGNSTDELSVLGLVESSWKRAHNTNIPSPGYRLVTEKGLLVELGTLESGLLILRPILNDNGLRVCLVGRLVGNFGS